MHKSIKNKALKGSIKGILLIVLLTIFYFQWSKIPWTEANSLSILNPEMIGLSIALIPLNLWFEFKKWTLTLTQSRVKTDKKVKLDSFFAGWITGVITPNMLGNFIGRMYYFQKRDRWSIVLNTLISNFAQFLPSILFGLIALLSLQQIPGQTSINSSWYILILLLILLLVLFYFTWHLIPFPQKIKPRFFKRLKGILQHSLSYRLQLFYLSILRHLVFSLQFFFMFNAFQVAMDFSILLWIWQLYLWTTLTPSILMGKLMVRESLAVWIFVPLGFYGLPILITSLLIWLGNVLLPALFGILILKMKR